MNVDQFSWQREENAPLNNTCAWCQRIVMDYDWLSRHARGGAAMAAYLLARLEEGPENIIWSILNSKSLLPWTPLSSTLIQVWFDFFRFTPNTLLGGVLPIVLELEKGDPFFVHEHKLAILFFPFLFLSLSRSSLPFSLSSSFLLFPSWRWFVELTTFLTTRNVLSTKTITTTGSSS